MLEFPSILCLGNFQSSILCNLWICQVLVEGGCSVNQVDSDLRSALRAACWAGHLACVEILLNAGAAVDQVYLLVYLVYNP